MSVYKASTRTKVFSSYRPYETDANSFIDEKDTLATRGWDNHRNNPIARGIIETLVTSIATLKHHSNLNQEVLGISDEQREQKEKEIEEIFDQTANHKECDYYRLSNFEQLQQQAMRTMLVDGSCLGILSTKQRENENFLTIKNVEGIQLQNKNNRQDSEKMQGGIEFNSNGIKAYWFLKYHPYNSINKNIEKWIRIPAYSGIRQNVLHLYEKERAGQRSGVGLLSSVLENVFMLDKMADAKLQRAVIGAMIALVIYNENKNGSLDKDVDVDENGNVITSTKPNYDETEKALKWEAGMTLELGDGQKAELIDPKPDETYKEFVETHMDFIASGVGIPASVIKKKFNSNYTASRGELLEAFKKVKQYRLSLEADYCQPYKEMVLLQAVLDGKIVLDGFLTDRAKRIAWCRSRWEGQPMGMIDPLKEIKSYQIAHDEGFVTGATISTNINGSSYDDNLRRQIREAKLEKKLFKLRKKISKNKKGKK